MKKWRMLLLALLLALLCGCAASEPLPDYAPEESQRLILYTSHKKEVWQPIVKEFEARTGVWVTVVEGGSNELLEQLAAKTDVPQADVMFGGGVESLESYQDLFAPYTCADADAILPQYRAKDDIWTPFSSLPLVFVYNPKLVGAEEITGWADLLRPELAGKIAFADPSVSGSSYTALVTMLCALPGETDEILQAFAENLDGKQLQSSGAVLTAVAGGQAVVGVTLEACDGLPGRRDELRAGRLRDPEGRAARGKRKAVRGFHGQPQRAEAPAGALLPPLGARGSGKHGDAPGSEPDPAGRL